MLYPQKTRRSRTGLLCLHPVSTSPCKKISRGGTASLSSFSARKSEHGAAILESFLAMILLGMIMFGVLQLFQVSVASMVTDYAAFRGARSAAVGFKDALATREAKVKSIPASGDMEEPYQSSEFISSYNQFEREKTVIRRYMKGTQWMEYSNWYGKTKYHMNYHCPDYGQRMEGDCGICGTIGGHVSTNVNGFNETMHFKFAFRDYPMTIPLHDWLTGREELDLENEVELANHSSAYLE